MHISQLHKVIERGEFSMVFVSAKGEKITIQRGVCTSWHSAGRTLNILICASGQVRTVRRVSIIEFNGEEIYL